MREAWYLAVCAVVTSTGCKEADLIQTPGLLLTNCMTLSKALTTMCLSCPAYKIDFFKGYFLGYYKNKTRLCMSYT